MRDINLGLPVNPVKYCCYSGIAYAKHLCYVLCFHPVIRSDKLNILISKLSFVMRHPAFFFSGFINYFFRLSFIVGLLLSRSPNAVIRGVTFVIINPFEGKIVRRSIPHIGIKVFKFHPSLANFNTSAAIVRPVFCSFVRAPLLHILPKIPLSFYFSSPCKAVSGAALRSLLVSKASAARAFAISQGRAFNGLLCAAITAAKPFPFSKIGQRNPSAKALISDVFKFRHTHSLQLIKVNINA